MIPRLLAGTIIFFLLVTTGSAGNPGSITNTPLNPLSISGLRQLANFDTATFELEYHREPIDGIKRRVVSFQVDGLRQYSIILEPAGKMPDDGWPALLMNHGHHPDPPRYGRVASGETDRPGDYYRALPMAFARQGFLVVVPDFRGHNDSEGTKYAQGQLESNWYSRDSIMAFRALDSLPTAHKTQRFMWGHSMGGAVTQRAILALQGEVKGASIWASSHTDGWKAAFYYTLRDAGLSDGLLMEKPALEKLAREIDALPFDFSPEQSDASRFVRELETPLIIHHSVHDLKSTPYHWSVELAGSLYSAGKPYEFFSYNSDKHLFEGKNLQQAIDRDVSFFRNLSKPAVTETASH